MAFNSATLYLTTVLIWGSTFYAIKFQLGVIAPEVSVVYRFGSAALILLGWCWLKQLPMRFTAQQHLWMMAQGLTLFGLNYLVVYWATPYLTSGLIAVAFSTLVLMNIVNSALFFGNRPTVPMITGALLGMCGIVLVFLPEVSHLELGSGLQNGAILGIVLSLASTYIASLGSMASTRNQKAGLPIVQTNAFGMAYGTIAMAVYALIRGTEFSFDSSFIYLTSLGYLVLFGSVIAFGSYLTLLGRIGPERASYAMVLFPIVGLGISTLFENYQWTTAAAMGVVLVLCGNVLVISSGKQLKRLVSLVRKPV